ncbi:hypothetical protein BCR59_26720 [Klebsiella pneumoniae]|nr:hypothetical protein BCR59_26720 [Klebsiella pneumoniae]
MVTSTVVWSFIQLMIPAVVSAAAFSAYSRAGGEGRGAAGVFNSIRWVNGRGGEGRRSVAPLKQ